MPARGIQRCGSTEGDGHGMVRESNSPGLAVRDERPTPPGLEDGAACGARGTKPTVSETTNLREALLKPRTGASRCCGGFEGQGGLSGIWGRADYPGPTRRDTRPGFDERRPMPIRSLDDAIGDGFARTVPFVPRQAPLSSVQTGAADDKNVRTYEGKTPRKAQANDVVVNSRPYRIVAESLSEFSTLGKRFKELNRGWVKELSSPFQRQVLAKSAG